MIRIMFPPQEQCLGLLGFLKEEKTMQTNRTAVIRPNLSTRAVCLILFCLCSHLAGDAAPLQITDSRLLNGEIALAWMAGANSYEVQRTESLAAPNWTTVLATVRTNAALPLEGNSGYYRLQNASTSSSHLVLTMTNLTTTDAFTATLEPRTNADMVFDLPSGANDVNMIQIVLAGSELQKFDIAFPSEGGFTIVTNGNPTAWGGSWTNSPGPGANEITYQGYLTNGTDVVMFSAVTDPEPIEVAISGIIGTINWRGCSQQFAGQWVACEQTAIAQATACFYDFFPPHSSYCIFVAHVTVAFDGSNNCGTCDCLHGCN